MLAEQLRRAALRATSDRFQSYFNDGIQRAFYPYSPGRVHMFVENHLSRGRFVHFTFSNLPNHPLKIWVDLLEEPYVLIDYMVEQVEHHFKTIYVEPDNDHIVLGEE